MSGLRVVERDDFPRFGARARVWARFERDLRSWLATPEGRFAVWSATRDAATGRGRVVSEERRAG